VLVGERKPPFWHARRIRPTRGTIASVAFDATWVLHREEARSDVMGFFHTHPSGPPSPSSRDDRTMWAWVSSLGKPLLCIIEAHGESAAYRYDDDTSAGICLPACQLFQRGMFVAIEDDLCLKRND
jgi:proteasome lid subunit RPN8/RPN11